MQTTVLTYHQYIDQYPIDPQSTKLILGTIHPHKTEQFQLPFFYGNISSIWQILSYAFPDELQQPLSLEGILSFLNARKIAVSDCIRSCKRKNDSALDQDLIPIELNTSLMDQIRDSKIQTIYFTSGFGKNSAFRLFYTKLLGLRITSTMRKQQVFRLPESIFGRNIKLILLLSPSGAANRSIVRSQAYQEQKHIFQDSKRPVFDFKVADYQQKFNDSSLS